MKPWEIELISVMSSSHVDDLQSNTLKFVKEMLKDIVKDVDKTPSSALLCNSDIKILSDLLKEKYL